jgi:hypothetical protein
MSQRNSRLRVISEGGHSVPKVDVRGQKRAPESTPATYPPGHWIRQASADLGLAEQKLRRAVAHELRMGSSVSDVARWARVSRTTVRRWRDEAREG